MKRSKKKPGIWQLTIAYIDNKIFIVWNSMLSLKMTHRTLINDK